MVQLCVRKWGMGNLSFSVVWWWGHPRPRCSPLSCGAAYLGAVGMSEAEDRPEGNVPVLCSRCEEEGCEPKWVNVCACCGRPLEESK